MVKTLLEKLKEIDNEADPFLDYIICVSFQKMNRRMANEVISLPYYNCLQNWDRSSMLPSQTPRPRHKDRDKHFINIIPRLAKVAHTEIPNLTKVVAAYPQPDGIYNEETRIEFHLLLCELLSSYKASLEHLGRIQLQNPKLPEILKALGRVRTFGRYLRTVVRSSAIETHLETINSFLVVDTRKSWTPEPEDSEDADFQCLKPYSMRKGKVLLPWESYRDWLILMVHYFDAADVIVRHIRQLKLNRVGFSIKIITPPHPDKVLLPWSELLENELLFPAIPGKSSGKEFVRFFSSMPKVDLEMFAVAIDSATRLELKLESDGLVQLDTDEIDALAQMVKRCTSVDWDDLNILSEEILALKESELVDRQVQMQAVVDSFQALSRRALFYNQLKDGPLQSGKKPRGTYHCEAYFASLLTLWDNASGQLVSDFKERMNTISAHGISEIKALLEKIKVGHIFLHCLNVC
jgi:hypothetical protein